MNRLMLNCFQYFDYFIPVIIFKISSFQNTTNFTIAYNITSIKSKHFEMTHCRQWPCPSLLHCIAIRPQSDLMCASGMSVVLL